MPWNSLYRLVQFKVLTYKQQLPTVDSDQLPTEKDI